MERKRPQNGPIVLVPLSTLSFERASGIGPSRIRDKADLRENKKETEGYMKSHYPEASSMLKRTEMRISVWAEKYKIQVF